MDRPAVATRQAQHGARYADALARHEHPERWAMRVNAVGSGYGRVVGDATDLIAAAERLGQRWLKGIGLARQLAGAG